MTDQNAEQRVEVIQQDRDAAKHFWNTVSDDWNSWDNLSADEQENSAIAFARHRLTFAATARSEVVEECARAIRRAGERVASIETPRMEGDNFAVTLCSHFDDGEGEQDEWGWTEAATAGYEEVISAIREHFNTAIRNLKPPAAEADFCGGESAAIALIREFDAFTKTGINYYYPPGSLQKIERILSRSPARDEGGA